MLGSSRVAAQLAASREGPGSMSDDDENIYMYRCVMHSIIEEIAISVFCLMMAL
jgi:hypothetical protein